MPAPATASIGSDELLAVIGRAYAPRNALRKTLGQLAQVFAAKSFSLVVRSGGAHRILDRKGEVLDSRTMEECWKLASVRRYRSDERLLIPLPIRGVDRLTMDRLKAVLVLSGMEDPERVEEALSRKIGEPTIRSLLGEHLANLLDWRDIDAYRAGLQRLIGSANQLTQSRDIAYQVARETRAATRYDGACVTLSWQEQEGVLRPLAVLAPSGSADDAQERRHRPVLQWGGEVDPSVLTPMEGQALLASEEVGGGLSVIAVDPNPHRPRLDSAVPQPVIQILTHLLRLLEVRGLAPGRTKLVIPIVSQSEFLGLQILSTHQISGFTERDALTAVRFAGFCGPALTQDRQLVVELEYLDTAAKFRPDLPLSESQPSVMTSLCERIRKHQGADRVMIIPYKYRQREIEISGIAAAGSPQFPEQVFDPYPKAVMERLLDTEEGTLECHLLPDRYGVERWHQRIGDGEDDLEVFEFEAGSDSFLERQKTRSFYAKVLVQEKKIPNAQSIAYPIGFLFIDYSRLRGLARSLAKGRPRISTMEKNWIGFYAEIVSRYLATQRAVESHFRIDREIRKLYDYLSEQEMSDAKGGMEALLEKILSVALKLVEGTAGVLAVQCGEHWDLKVIAAIGVNEEKSRKHIAYGEGVTGHCGEQLAPTVIADSKNPRTWPAGVTPLPWVEGSRSEIAVPIRAGQHANRLIGVLDVESQHAIGAFGEDEVETLKQLGRASALAIDLASRLEQLRSLRHVGERIDRAPGVTAAFDAVLTEAIQVTGAYAASARTIDSSGTMLEPVLHKGVKGEYAGRPVSSHSGVVGWVYTEQRTCVIHDFNNRRQIQEEYGEGLVPVHSRDDARSEVCVPITWDGDRIGVLNLEHVHEFGLSAYRDYAEALASQIAFVLAQRRQQSRRLLSKDEQVVSGVTQFAAALAHEVEKQFTVIIDATGELGEAWSEEKVETIHKTAQQGRAETSRLIQFGADPLAPVTSVDIADLLSGVVGEYKDADRCEVKPLRVNSSEGGPLIISCKPSLIAWCVRTLVNNAIAHRKGRRKPTIEVSVDCPTPGWLWIMVADDGPGVSPDLLPNLFAWDWKSTERTSAGKGLPLLRSFVESMDGQIVAGQVGEKQGLAVRIGLPRELRQW